jgi:regulator of replication initiation timing
MPFQVSGRITKKMVTTNIKTRVTENTRMKAKIENTKMRARVGNTKMRAKTETQTKNN